jgi:hypothetical protein
LEKKLWFLKRMEDIQLIWEKMKSMEEHRKGWWNLLLLVDGTE